MRTCLEMLEILDEYLKNENISRRQYYSFDENKICIIQSLTDKSSR